MTASPVLLAAQRADWFVDAAELAATFIEGVGIAIVVVGGVLALGTYLVSVAGTGSREVAYRLLRRNLGRSILLGLEFLVAADIISTVLVTPTLTSALTLAIIVLIRTFLSWSLELEVEGRWPWQRADAPAAEAGA